MIGIRFWGNDHLGFADTDVLKRAYIFRYFSNYTWLNFGGQCQSQKLEMTQPRNDSMCSNSIDYLTVKHVETTCCSYFLI